MFLSCFLFFEGGEEIVIGGRPFSFDSPVCEELRSDGISGGYLFALFAFFVLVSGFVLIGFFEVILSVFAIEFDVDIIMVEMRVDVSFVVFLYFFGG